MMCITTSSSASLCGCSSMRSEAPAPSWIFVQSKKRSALLTMRHARGKACREMMHIGMPPSPRLAEASVSQVLSQLRNLSAIMLHNCDLYSPLTLWESHGDSLDDDILHQYQYQNTRRYMDFSDLIYTRL